MIKRREGTKMEKSSTVQFSLKSSSYVFLIVFLVVVVLAFVNSPLAWPGDPTRPTRCPWPMLFPTRALSGFLATALAGFFVVVRVTFAALSGAWLDTTPGATVPGGGSGCRCCSNRGDARGPMRSQDFSKVRRQLERRSWKNQFRIGVRINIDENPLGQR